MPKNRIIIILGALVALIPLSGLPLAGKSFVEIVSGLSIIGLSVWGQIDKKISLKAKAQMRAARKSFTPEPSIESSQASEAQSALGKRVTDFYPKTGQTGRRASDLKVIPPIEEPVVEIVEETEN